MNEANKPEEAVGGKKYEKVCIYSVTDKSCPFADRRISIRQQSDQLCSVLGENQKARSASTVYRHREKARTKALIESNSLLNAATAIQLCCDGRVVLSMNRYMFLDQFTDGYDQKHNKSNSSKIVYQKYIRKCKIASNTISKEACVTNFLKHALSWSIPPL